MSTVLIRLIPGRSWYGISGVTIALLYQYLLSRAGLREFVLYGTQGNDSRQGFVDGNREGLCSCVGYLSLYLIGVHLGRFLFQKRWELISQILTSNGPIKLKLQLSSGSLIGNSCSCSPVLAYYHSTERQREGQGRGHIFECLTHNNIII